MSIFNVISLLGGLALFLYGMTVMSNGLERASGGKLEQALEKLTSNVFRAVLLGAAVTAAIQSSSATTVIVVGLVNAKILKLRQAIGIIMGANIGTTITAHIIRLADIEGSAGMSLINFLKPTTLAPLAAIIGILMYMTARKTTRRELGIILIGFGILFTGMFAMEEAVYPLREMPEFANWFGTLSNPILGVLAGMFVTAVIQSSSASIGILQALTATGAVTFASAFPIIMGQNIGTCITPVLASMGASKNAKRTAFVHVVFNVVGTVIFLIAIYAIQYTVGFPFWSEPISRGGIADFHTLFNVTVTILFIPFTRLLEKLATVCIRTSGKDHEYDEDLAALDERFLQSPGYAISQARDAVVRMSNLALENYRRSLELVEHYDRKKLEMAREVENVIDRLQSRVDQYLIKLSQSDLSEADNIALSEVLQVVNEFERIGDHADNICNCAVDLHNKSISFSDQAKEELHSVSQAVQEILELAVKGYLNRDTGLAHTIEPLEEVINILVETLKVRHSDRLTEGLCSLDATFPFVEILYNLERIADHCSNVGVHVISYSGSGHALDRHEYLREMHHTQTEDYRTKFEMYDKKYFEQIKKSQN